MRLKGTWYSFRGRTEIKWEWILFQERNHEIKREWILFQGGGGGGEEL